ncbi:MAG: BTAD domain-containing putative transcriptional regulator, partial [Candidatus Bipolaricaulia bacterium]
CTVDSEVFKTHLNQARDLESNNQFEQAIQEYEQAVALYQGEFLADDRYEDWAIPHTERWQQTYLDTLSQLAECHARLGQYRRAIARCNKILEIEPYREPTYRQLMLYHYLVGDPEQAIRTYERFRTLLNQELDAEPLPETQQLYGQIVDREIAGIDEVYQPVSVVERTPIPTLLKRVPFVSREGEYAELVTHLEEAKDDSGRTVLIFGETGIGKTRLVEELIRYGQYRYQVRTLEGRCHKLSTSLSYQPLIDAIRGGLSRIDPQTIDIGPLWLAEVADLVPELRDLIVDLPANPSLPPELKRNRLFEGLVQFFAGLAQAEGPLVLFLDDLHWVDPSTLDFLAFFCPRVVDHPILIIGTYRGEEVEEAHPLINLIEYGERQGTVHHYELPRLSEQAVDQLLSEIAPQLDRSFQERIYQETQGNPFFIVAVLQHLFEEGLLRVREDGTWASTVEEIPSEDRARGLMFPEMAKGVIQRRLRRLKDEERQLLQLAAVIGERFEFELLQRIEGGETTAALETLEGLTQAQLLVEQADMGDYAFSHGKIWEAVYYDELSGARRKWLHRNVGEALERAYANRLEEYSGQIAEHYYRGEVWEKAVKYLLKAGEKARRAYLNDEAIGYFQRTVEQLQGSALGETHKDWQLEALTGLGEVYHGVGNEEIAEDHFREAIALGQEIGLAPRELVRLYHWLGEVLWWQSRHDEVIRIGEEGLALLGDDTESTESVEAALMNQTIASSHNFKRNFEKGREFIYRNAKFIQQLPYSAELRPAYIHIFGMYALDKDIEEALKWLQILEQKAEGHHDVRALGDVYHHEGDTLANQGDLHGAISQYQQALELFTKIGDANHANRSLIRMGEVSLALGDLQKAEEYAHRGLETAEIVGDKIMIAWACERMGTIFLCQSAWEEAEEAFQRAAHLYRETSSPYEVWPLMSLGRTYLAQKKRREALMKCQEVFALVTLESSAFPYALTRLEEAYDNPKTFRIFCQRFREGHPEADGSPFVQWYLEPTEAIDFPQNLIHDEFADSLSSDWAWQDSFDDSSFTVNDGLEIHAANGRDLGSITKWQINLNAPRILRPISGDFSVQTVCMPVSKEKPAIGGLVLWKDRENYLRLTRGVRGEHEISLEGCLGNKDVIIGHGRLASERVYLRLERLGDRVNALCSTDGMDWYAVGSAAFPIEDPVEVGLHAIGTINRIIYPGAYPDGTAIHFESFQLWGTKVWGSFLPGSLHIDPNPTESTFRL